MTPRGRKPYNDNNVERAPWLKSVYCPKCGRKISEVNIAEHDTMFLNYCSYFAELKRIGQCTTIVFQGSREQLFDDKKNDIRNWLTADVALL